MSLINRTDIATKVQISDSVYDDTLNEYIEQAQFLDMQDLLGVEFYNDILRNKTDANYVALLDGGTYEISGLFYTNVGLKTPIIYYTNARYKRFGSQQDTAFGLIEKSNEFSDRVSKSEKQVTYKLNQQMAFKYWRNVEAFLNRKSADYPLWNTGNCNSRRQTFRVTPIR
jgi:hypothetical protein